MEGMTLSPSQRLRTARIAKGHANAKRFAEHHRLSYATYQAHESGRLPITEKAAKKYAKILAIPSDWILYGETTSSSKETTGTTAIHLRKKAMEPIVLPLIVETILKVINRFDDQIDYKRLCKNAYIIMSEILAKTGDLNDIESYIATIVTLDKENLEKTVLNQVK